MIVGFHGVLGSGKDEAGRRFADMVSLPSKHLSFARKLKESAAALLDVPVEAFEQWKNDPEAVILVAVGDEEVAVLGEDYGETGYIVQPKVITSLTVREFLQRYGTESHRDIFGDNFWVDQALNDVDDYGTLYYVTDVRFPNELEGITRQGGVVVRVLRGDEPEDYSDVHPSEWPLEGCHLTIDNSIRDDNYAYLDEQLEGVAQRLGIPLKEKV